MSTVLARRKFDRYLAREEREKFLTVLVQVAVIVAITEEIRACRDSKDDKFLLTLNPFRGIPILTPAQFLAWIPRDSEAV